MILTKSVWVGVCYSTIKYYEPKGYDFSEFINDKGRYSRGSKIEIRIEDLHPGSNYSVLYKCDFCGVEKTQEFNKVTGICHSCTVNTEKYRKNMGNIKRGVIYPEETREKHRKPRPDLRGQNSPNWKNKSEEDRRILEEKYRSYTEYRQWRKELVKKYNYSCQKCGRNDCKITVHHLESFLKNKELRTDINNGTVLCLDHHKQFHKIYGHTNTTKEQFEEFLRNY